MAEEHMARPNDKRVTGKTRQAKPRARLSSVRAVRAASSDMFESPLSISKTGLLDSGGRSDRKFRQLLYDFSVLGRHLESARAHLASHLRVSSPQYNIVMLIAQYQGANGVSVTEVAQHLHASTAFITSEVRKLEGLGLVQKQPNPSDGRGVLLRITPAGEAGVRSVAPERLLVNDQLFRDLSGEDFQHLSRIVASLIDDFAQTIEMLEGRRRDRTRRADRLASSK